MSSSRAPRVGGRRTDGETSYPADVSLHALQTREHMRTPRTRCTSWRTICRSIPDITSTTSSQSHSCVSSSLSWGTRRTLCVSRSGDANGQNAPSLRVGLMKVMCIAVAGDHTRSVTIATPTSGGLMSFVKKTLTCLGCRSPLTATSKVGSEWGCWVGGLTIRELGLKLS